MDTLFRPKRNGQTSFLLLINDFFTCAERRQLRDRVVFLDWFIIILYLIVVDIILFSVRKARRHRANTLYSLVASRYSVVRRSRRRYYVCKTPDCLSSPVSAAVIVRCRVNKSGVRFRKHRIPTRANTTQLLRMCNHNILILL